MARSLRLACHKLAVLKAFAARIQAPIDEPTGKHCAARQLLALRTTNLVVLPADRSFTPIASTMLRRKPIAATASIQPQQARTCGKIPIAHAAPPTLTSRDFVPWRFLDAGQQNRVDSVGIPASKNLHKGGHGKFIRSTLVSNGEQRLRDIEAECLCSFELITNSNFVGN